MQYNTLPPWLRDYMAGASQELYKLHAFPTVLHGQTVLDATAFFFDAYHAVLLAVEPTAGPAAHSMLVTDLQQVFQKGVTPKPNFNYTGIEPLGGVPDQSDTVAAANKS